MNNLQKMESQLKEWGLNPKTFCFAPYVTTDLDQLGHIRSCYRGKDDLGNWKTEKFEDVFNNDYYKNLRQSLYKGKKHSNCVSCWVAEEKNSQSPRADIFDDTLEYISDIETFIKEIKEDNNLGQIENLQRVEIRPSLLCNLRCMHCGPDSSTKWIQKLTDKETFNTFKNIVGIDAAKTTEDNITNENIAEYYKNGLSSESKYKEEIKGLLSSIKLIQFAGGEPLLTPEHEEWLDYLVNVSKTAKHQDLDYNSNFNVKSIDKFFPYWEQFKSVRIRASIDTSFETYEYFRSEGDINLLRNNITRFNEHFFNNANVSICGTVTFNMFSALSWNKIVNDWIENKLNFHASLVITHPISSLNLPNDLKHVVIKSIEDSIANVENLTDDDQFIKNFRKHSKNCLEFVKNSNYNNKLLSKKTCDYIEMCDKINRKNVFNYFPELKDFWHGLA